MCYRVQKGFTLLELMVSIVIIGIILSFAVLSIGDGGQSRRLEQEVQQLVALLTLASQEAILQGKDIGIAFTQHQYSFYLWQNQDWQLLTQDDLFHPRELSVDLQINLFVEGEEVVICEVESTCKPHLLLLSSGELIPFELTFTVVGSALTYVLEGTLNSVECRVK